MDWPAFLTRSFWRRHPVLKWLIVSAIPLLLIPPLKFLIVDYHFAYRDLQNAIAEVDQAEAGWRLPDIEAARRAVDADKNSALVVGRAFEKLPTKWTWKSADRPDFAYAVPTSLLPEDLAAELKSELAARREAVEVARTAADCPYGRYPIRYTDDFLSTSVKLQADARPVLTLLEYDVRDRLQDGDAAGAETSLLAMWNVSRSLGDEPILVMQLYRMAMATATIDSLERVLARGHLSLDSVRAWRKRIADEADEEPFDIGLRGERAGIHQLLTNLEDGTVSFARMSGAAPDSFEGRFGHLLGRNSIARSHAWFLRKMPELLATRDVPAWERRAVLQQIDDRLRTELQSDRNLKLAGTLVPSLIKTAEADIRTDTRLRCVLCGLAVEEFRLTTGKWPASLETLVEAKLMPAVPTDPFSGEPLQFRRTKDGAVVYSVSKTGTARGDAWDTREEENIVNRVEFRLWDM